MNAISNKTKVLSSYTPEQIVDLTDGDSNNVYLLDKRYIFKEYFSQHQLAQETAGYILFNKLSSYGVPLLLDKGDTTLLLEYIDSDSCFALNEKKLVDKPLVADKTTNFLAEVYWNYRYFDKNKVGLFDTLSWENRLESIISRAHGSIFYLQNKVTQQSLDSIGLAIKTAQNLDIDSKQITFLHRDLHLDNILIKRDQVGRDKNYFIDFEHCMEGPIELELQNSIFWDDAWSIPVQQVRQSLKYDHNIPYSLENEELLLDVYYLDQINLAIEKRDLEKIKILLDRYNIVRCCKKN